MQWNAIRAGSFAVAAIWTGMTAPLAAQEWHLTAHAGRIRSALDPAAATASFALGIRYDDPEAGLRLTSGVPASSAEPLWGSVGGWKRFGLRRGGWIAGVDVLGNAFMTVDRTSRASGPLPGPFDPPVPVPPDRSGHALAGQALPLIGFEARRVLVHARMGLSRYAARFGQHEVDRVMRLLDAQLTIAPVAGVAVMPVARRFRADGEASVDYAGVSVAAAAGRGSVWGSAGRWLGSEGRGTPWSAGARLRLQSLVSLDIATRHDTFDPLFLQPPQTSWSVGLSVRLGGPTPIGAAPVPAIYRAGRATIRLPAADARTAPSIAGDFNAWKPAIMRREGDHWTYQVAVDPGVYHYAFVNNRGEWFVPAGVPGRKDDGMGGHVAVLVVQ